MYFTNAASSGYPRGGIEAGWLRYSQTTKEFSISVPRIFKTHTVSTCSAPVPNTITMSRRTTSGRGRVTCSSTKKRAYAQWVCDSFYFFLAALLGILCSFDSLYDDYTKDYSNPLIRNSTDGICIGSIGRRLRADEILKQLDRVAIYD